MKIDGQRIKQLREGRGWSQEHLASLCGLSARTVQRLEAEGNASLESRMAVAAALEVAAVDLLPVQPASNPHTVTMAPSPAGTRTENLMIALALLLTAMLYGGYNIGKDLALRDNARCDANPTQCQR